MTATTGQVPVPGWYADPAGSVALRWWDGGGWTDHLQAPAGASPAPSGQPAPGWAPSAPAATSRRPSARLLAALGALVVAAGGYVASTTFFVSSSTSAPAAAPAAVAPVLRGHVVVPLLAPATLAGASRSAALAGVASLAARVRQPYSLRSVAAGYAGGPVARFTVVGLVSPRGVNELDVLAKSLTAPGSLAAQVVGGNGATIGDEPTFPAVLGAPLRCAVYAGELPSQHGTVCVWHPSSGRQAVAVFTTASPAATAGVLRAVLAAWAHA